MADETLFFKYDLNQLIERQRQSLLTELDGMSDERLISLSQSELEDYCAEKYAIDLPVLGEPQVDQRRTKMRVSRYGGMWGDGDGSVTVDGEEFTLEVPYTGDQPLFWTRGSTWSTNPPQGTVTSTTVSTSLQLREPNADRVNAEFEGFLTSLATWLNYLKADVDAWNARIRGVARERIEARRARAEKARAATSGLKFALKARPGSPTTYKAPVAPKKIAPVFPKPTGTSAPEPVLTDEAYRDVLDTIQQMSEVMERSPHAFAAMDEETLRFQFLVPLNARFEGEARGEVFNYNGKTDILIAHKGRNIFVAELKVWSGPAAFSAAIDQLLGYLSWRDTKAAVVLFNRNKNFSAMLDQIDPTVRAHPNFVAAGPTRGATEFRYTLRHKDDGARRLTVTILAFDLPKEA